MNKSFVVVAASVMVAGAIATAAPADAVTMTVVPRAVTCSSSISADYHTGSAHCTGTLSGASQFRAAVTFCTTGNCGVFYGPWVNFGGTSSVTEPSAYVNGPNGVGVQFR
ncbi:MAG: hypothetical protein ABI140_14400 [Jatrophihabitantaceae bacterium]